MFSSTASQDAGAFVVRIRGALLALLGLAMVGTAADLLLLEHYEDAWQWPPLVLVLVGIGVAAWVWRSASRAAVRALVIVMLLLIVTGAVGVGLHFDGNKEFQQEMDPDLTGWPLFVKVIHAKVPPALAPASLVQIGLLGLLCAYAYRSPATSTRSSTPTFDRSTE